MTETISSTSSRGWVVLTLVGGSALAVPFMHKSGDASDSVASHANVAIADAGPTVEQQSGFLAERRVVGVRPNTDAIARELAAAIQPQAVDLPAWAVRGDIIDEWIDSGVAESLPSPRQVERPTGPAAEVRTWLNEVRPPADPKEQNLVAKLDDSPNASGQAWEPIVRQPALAMTVDQRAGDQSNVAVRSGGVPLLPVGNRQSSTAMQPNTAEELPLLARTSDASPKAARTEVVPDRAPRPQTTPPRADQRRKHFVYQPGHKP